MSIQRTLVSFVATFQKINVICARHCHNQRSQNPLSLSMWERQQSLQILSFETSISTFRLIDSFYRHQTKTLIYFTKFWLGIYMTRSLISRVAYRQSRDAVDAGAVAAVPLGKEQQREGTVEPGAALWSAYSCLAVIITALQCTM